ncbi:hypothetical protein [Rhodococcus triatomae]
MLRTEFGLDYESLRNNNDPVDVAHQIMQAACGPLPDGTIEDHEQRRVAAAIAEFVLQETVDGVAPPPEEVVREAMGLILFEAICSETADKINKGEYTPWEADEAQRQLRDATESWAERVELGPVSATESDFVEAIASGIELMHTIWDVN